MGVFSGIAVTRLGGFYATVNLLLIQLANFQCLLETGPNIPRIYECTSF